MSQENPTFQRAAHDKENPYVMISRELVRDGSISPACRWLIIYLLTNTEGFTIRLKQVINHLKGMKGYGRNNIYEIVDEAIEAGYIYREIFYVNNLAKTRYFVSETPKFKKCFRRPEVRDAEVRDPEVGDALKKEQSSLSEKKEGAIISKVDPPSQAPASDAPKLAPDKSKFSERALEEAKFLRNQILQRLPKSKEPDLKKWAEEFERLHELDKRSWEEIRAMVLWVSEDKFWPTVILSPKKLREKWDSMEAQRTPVDNKGSRISTNRALAYETKSFLKGSRKYDSMLVTGIDVTNLNTNEIINYEMHPKAFEAKIASMFNLTKVS